MSHYLIVTRFAPHHDINTLRARAKVVKQHTAEAVPELSGATDAKYILLGSSVGAIDVFQTENADAVFRLANIIAAHGEAQTEVLPALPWGDYVSAYSDVKHQPTPRAAGAGKGRKYAILSRFSPGMDHATLPQRSTAVRHNIFAAAPTLTGKWSDEFITLGGSFDGLDIVESDDILAVAKAANVIRVHGGCTTEVAVAVPWNDFLSSLP